MTATAEPLCMFVWYLQYIHCSVCSNICTEREEKARSRDVFLRCENCSRAYCSRAFLEEIYSEIKALLRRSGSIHGCIDNYICVLGVSYCTIMGRGPSSKAQDTRASETNTPSAGSARSSWPVGIHSRRRSPPSARHCFGTAESIAS